MRARILVLLALVALTFWASRGSALAGGRIALVIGNGAYASAPKLRNPASDATDIAAALKSVGFEVELQTDAGRDAMAAAFSRFSARAANADVALFYYAGHGVQAKGENYLIPTDANVTGDADLALQTLDLSRLQDAMATGAQVRIIILDACRNNPFAEAAHRGIGGARGLAPMTTRDLGSLIVYSTRPDGIAADGQGRNSPFAAALLRHIVTPGLEIRQMMSRVRKDVLAATGNEQLPWDSSSLTDDVFLSTGPGPVETPAAKPVETPVAAVEPTPEPTARAASDPCADAEDDAILTPVRNVFAALRSRNLGLYAEQWAADALYVNRQTGETRGKAGIVAAKRSGFARWSSVEASVQGPRIVSRKGRTAILEDNYTISIISGGRRLPPDRGHEAYRISCGDDGQWRISRNEDYLP